MLKRVISDVKDNRSIKLVGNWMLQAYADGVIDRIISSTLMLIEAGQRIGLTINDDETKYVIVSRRSIDKQNSDVGAPYTLEQANTF